MPASFESQLEDYARAWELSRATSRGYSLLMAWGAHYGLQPAAISSGLRSQRRQRELLEEWRRYGSRGPNRLVVQPALESDHLSGQAFDLERVPHLWIYGQWAPLAGLEWGGNYRQPDPVHFALRSS